MPIIFNLVVKLYLMCDIALEVDCIHSFMNENDAESFNLYCDMTYRWITDFYLWEWNWISNYIIRTCESITEIIQMKNSTDSLKYVLFQ